MPVQIRPIEPADNVPLQQLIKTVLLELGSVTSEYLSDPNELVDLHALYRQARSRYYVLVDADTERVLGGGGLAPLAGADNGIGEIQKMYFSPELRGQGMGSRLLERLIHEAEECAFTSLYLETMPNMLGAIKLYERSGFQRIPGRMGSTGHECCTVFMARTL